jgi:hypothetical protein
MLPINRVRVESSLSVVEFFLAYLGPCASQRPLSGQIGTNVPRKTSQGPKNQTMDRTPGQKSFLFSFFCRRKCGRDRRPNFKIGRRKETVPCGRKLNCTIVYICVLYQAAVRPSTVFPFSIIAFSLLSCSYSSSVGALSSRV